MKQSERTQYLLREVQSAQSVIAQSEYTGRARLAAQVGVLRATLAGMAGLGEFPTHASCFEPEVTEAIKHLLDTLD